MRDSADHNKELMSVANQTCANYVRSVFCREAQAEWKVGQLLCTCHDAVSTESAFRLLNNGKSKKSNNCPKPNSTNSNITTNSDSVVTFTEATGGSTKCPDISRPKAWLAVSIQTRQAQSSVI